MTVADALPLRSTQLARPPTSLAWRSAIAIGSFAVAVRVAVFLCIAARLHLSLASYANLYDGQSYLIMARAMLGDPSQLSEYHARVFPGFPAMLAAAHLVLRTPLGATALGINWLSAGVAAAMAARLFGDVRVGVGMAVLIPHYVMNSTMAMSEAPLLALTTTGLLLARRSGTAPMLAGGVLLGMGGLVRPMACFALAAGVGYCGRGRRAVVLVTTAAVVVLAGMGAMHAWRGDALMGVAAQAGHSYSGRILDWPLRSLVMTPIRRHVAPGRVAYLWAHALLAVIACVAAVVCRRPGHAVDALAAVWLVGNTAFALCVGDIWGFECLHRFLVPALPALLWTVRGVLPRRAIAWGAVTVVSCGIAIFSAGGN